MKCIILAAGYATRLYPLTENFPKPLLKVGDKTIIDWLIDDVRESNKIEEFIIITNHKFASIFNDWAKDKKEIRIVDDLTSTNETRRGAVKDILYAIDTCALDSDFLILAGDNVLDFSLKGFIDYALAKQASCVMRYEETNKQKLSKSGVLTINNGDQVLEMEEKPSQPKSNWCSPPFYYYTKEDSKKISKALSEGCGYDAPGSFIAWLCQHSPVYSYQMPGKRYDIGNLQSYQEVQATYQGITVK